MDRCGLRPHPCLPPADLSAKDLENFTNTKI
jgi:hypothetical protein